MYWLKGMYIMALQKCPVTNVCCAIIGWNFAQSKVKFGLDFFSTFKLHSTTDQMLLFAKLNTASLIGLENPFLPWRSGLVVTSPPCGKELMGPNPNRENLFSNHTFYIQVGELCGGSLREHRPHVLESRCLTRCFISTEEKTYAYNLQYVGDKCKLVSRVTA
jgi:hypothetical protein